MGCDTILCALFVLVCGVVMLVVVVMLVLGVVVVVEEDDVDVGTGSLREFGAGSVREGRNGGSLTSLCTFQRVEGG